MSTEERREAIEQAITAEEAAAAMEPPPEVEGEQAEEAEQPAQPEQPEEAPAEPQQQSGGDPRVALRQEREENRDLKNEVAELRGHLQALIQQQQKPPEPQQPAEPEDPEPQVATIEQYRAGDVPLEDYLAGQQQRQAWADRQREKQERRVQEFIEGESQRQQQSRQQQEFARAIIESETRFRQTTPDYDQAFDKLLTERAGDLSSTGLVDDETARRIITKEIAALAQTAIRAGKDPASYLYALSRRRGFGRPTSGLAGMVPQHGVERAPSSNPLQALLDADEEDLFSGKVNGRALLRGGSP